MTLDVFFRYAAIIFVCAIIVLVCYFALQGLLARLGPNSRAATPTRRPASATPFSRAEAPEVDDGEVRFRLGSQKAKINHLYGNVLITGGTGSGKTSAGIYPLLEDLITKVPVGAEGDTHERVGALNLDQKGETTGAMLWFAHKAGRNILDDVVLIGGYSSRYLAKMRDEHGRFFYMSANVVPGGARTCGFDRFILSHHAVFSLQRKGLPTNPSIELIKDGKSKLAELLSGTWLSCEGVQPEFVGWRHDSLGLVRIAESQSVNETVTMRNKGGAKVAITPPTRLRYEEMVAVETGQSINLIDPAASPEENAKQLAMGLFTETQDYLLAPAEKHLTHLIAAWRAAHPSQEMSIIDLFPLLSEDMAAWALGRRLIDLKAENASSKYLLEEWKSADASSRPLIIKPLLARFAPLANNPNLAASWSKETIDFRRCCNEGMFFCLNLTEWMDATTARFVGRLVKSRFQAMITSRPSSTEINRTRPVIFLWDEFQESAGPFDVQDGLKNRDLHCLAMARQQRVLTIAACSSEALLRTALGSSAKVDLLVASFENRIWFAGQDWATNARAVRMCRNEPGQQAHEAYSETDFSGLGTLECITRSASKVVNKGLPTLTAYTASKETVERLELFRKYEHVSIEEILRHRGETRLLDQPIALMTSSPKMAPKTAA